MNANYDLANQTFADAMAYVKAAGLLSEVDWQMDRDFGSFTETEFLREAAWVILCTGFRESIVRRMFDHISLSFCDWESSDVIMRHASVCITSAMASIRCRRKYEAIVTISEHLNYVGFDKFKARILDDPIGEIKQLPYIGPVTSLHLAKNLGFETAKPDRHLTRLTKVLGFSSAQNLCEVLSTETGMPVSAIDLVLWRYMADVGSPVT